MRRSWLLGWSLKLFDCRSGSVLSVPVFVVFGPQVRPRRCKQVRRATVQELFSDLKEELSHCTPLATELSLVLRAGREYLEKDVERQGRGIQLFSEMLEWQRSQRGQRHGFKKKGNEFLEKRHLYTYTYLYI